MQTVFEGGNLVIRAEREGERGLVCGMDAIAAWRALLGTTSVAETCAAMMQARESVGSYDPQTGRNAYTTAYEGLEAALSDTAAQSVSMMSDSGEVQDDPMTAARNMTRAALGLPTITNVTDAAIQTATLSSDEAADATPGTGIDLGCVDVAAIGRLFDTDEMRADLDECEERFYESIMPRQSQQD